MLLKGCLEGAFLYELSQIILTRHGCWKTFVERDLRPVAGQRLLDLGCGTGIILDFLPVVDYWGLDSNSRYIRFAQKKATERVNFICADLARTPWLVEGLFDLATATGVLHHLSDEQAVDLFKNVRKVLKPEGRFVTFDGCFEKGQSVIARMFLSMDRGRFVRTRPAYEALARPFFGRVQSRIENKFLRVPYTHLIMEMSDR